MMLARTMMSFAMVARPVVAVIGVTVIAVRPLVLVCRIRRIGIGVRLRMAVIGLRLPLSMAAVAQDLVTVTATISAIVMLGHRRRRNRDRQRGQAGPYDLAHRVLVRSEEHTSELQELMRISYAVFCLKKKKEHIRLISIHNITCLHNHTKIVQIVTYYVNIENSNHRRS